MTNPFPAVDVFENFLSGRVPHHRINNAVCDRPAVAAKSSSRGLLWHQFSGAVDQFDELAPVTSLIETF